MLPVNPKSKLSAAQFVDLIKGTHCLPDWMRRLFSVKAHHLQIADKYTYPKTSPPPGWFGTWYTAALTVTQGNDWELTTGLVESLPQDLSRMTADGVSIGKPDPNGQWTDFPQIMNHDNWEGGITVPTQALKNELNAQKDAKLHYSSVIVPQGSARGAIVVVNRIKDKKGEAPLNSDDIVGTLFHEIYHAGQASQDKPSADADDRFNAITKAINVQFTGCAVL